MLFPLLAIGAIAALATSKKQVLPGPPFTYGLAELKKGHAYQFESTIEMAGVMDPGEFANGLHNGLLMAGAWDVYIPPALPIRMQYSLLSYDHRPLSVGAPVEWTVGNLTGRITVNSMREVAKHTALQG